jgi:[protein-PII] uridylyltransferase
MKGDEIERLERMMKRVYSKMIDIFYISAYVVDANYNKHFKKDYKKLGEEYYAQNKEFFIHAHVKPDVAQAMKSILAFVSGKYRPSYNFLAYLRDCAHAITPEDRNSKEIFNNFISILSSDNAFSALNVMKLSDFLYRYLKPFRLIRHYIIYNTFHTYTVDEHSLESIRAMELLVKNQFNEYERSKVSDLTELAKKHHESLWILKITLLFHDIGKAIPGDHSKNGVEIAHMFFTQSPLLHRYRGVVEFLIENHLLLTEIVRRSDIQNVGVILDLSKKFMRSAFPSDYLDYLYLITYCDVYATNPTNFTGYTATLLMQIYRKTKLALSGKIDKDYEKRMFEEKIRSASKLVRDDGLERFIRFLGVPYTNQTSEEEIVADYALCKSISPGETRLEVRNFNEYLKIKIFTPDRLGVFACIAGVLLMNGANIVKANIFTYGALAFDVFDVTDIFGANLSATSMRSELASWIERLERSLLSFVSDGEKLAGKISEMKQKITPTPAIFRKQAHIHASLLENGRYLIEISGTDRPALLYDIAKYLADESISIQNAIIDTVGWHIQDKFEAVSLNGLSEQDLERIKANLKNIVENPTDTK